MSKVGEKNHRLTLSSKIRAEGPIAAMENFSEGILKCVKFSWVMLIDMIDRRGKKEVCLIDNS